MSERSRAGLRLTRTSRTPRSVEGDVEGERLGYQALVDLAPDPYLITDEDGGIRGCNVAAADLLNVSQQCLVGMPLPSFMDAGVRREFRLQIDAVRRAGVALHWRSELRMRGGSTVPIAVSAAPIVHGQRVSGLRWLIRDDSEHQAAHSRLLQLSEELAARAAERTVQVETAARLWADAGARGRHRAGAGTSHSYADLLGRVSHEMRTPLAAAHGYIELLRRGAHGELSAVQHADIDSVAACHEHVLRVLDNALAVARLDSGHLDLSLARIPVAAALQEVQVYIQPDCQAKGVDYTCRGGPPATLVLADRAKLHQIMLNLLTNAVKFTPSGGSVTVAWHATGHQVAISVSDTGIGIPASDRERVFEPYVRVMRPGAAESGTGLGLAISRKLARAMGGEVSVASTANAGSTFTLTLPLARRAAR